MARVRGKEHPPHETLKLPGDENKLPKRRKESGEAFEIRCELDMKLR